MSEIDIELQKQTKDISVNEIMKEVDVVKVALGKNNTQEYTEGEQIDCK